MFHSPVIAAADKRPGISRLLAVGVLAVAFVLLAWDAQLFFAAALKAIRYPFNLDYGEGIVWQQAQQMRDGTAYGGITAFPSIVFHYPPLYHAMTLGFNALSGIDMLKSGRIVSVAATLVMALLAGLIGFQTVRTKLARNAALLCAAVASLATLTMWPVTTWAPLMRVDMVAMAFALAGISFTMQAFTRPRLVHLASVCFVASLFAKQTAIAAPAAAFLTLFLLRPRTALAGIASSTALGLVVLGTLSWVTDAGFVRHIFLYNINRLDFTRLGGIVAVMARHCDYLCIVVLGLASWRGEISGLFAVRELRENLGEQRFKACLLLLVVYLIFAAVMMLTIAKIGSNINYILETLCVVAILVGIGIKDAAVVVTQGAQSRDVAERIMAVGLPLLLAVQALAVPAPLGTELSGRKLAEMQQIVEMIRSSTRPVISDDMVLIKRAGRDVVWEPSIFSELASKGKWDEKPFVHRIRSGGIGFFITVGHRGQQPFDSRYNPAVADAMDAAYPIQKTMAGYILHLPRPQTIAQ